MIQEATQSKIYDDMATPKQRDNQKCPRIKYIIEIAHVTTFFTQNIILFTWLDRVTLTKGDLLSKTAL